MNPNIHTLTHEPWNKGKLVGQKAPLKLKDIWASQDGKAQLEVALNRDTVWLSQGQMATLFDTTTDNISLHLKNICQEKELNESATTEESSVVRQEGKRNVRRQIKHYNLDAIVSVS
jgi:hypothetical protein